MTRSYAPKSVSVITRTSVKVLKLECAQQIALRRLFIRAIQLRSQMANERGINHFLLLLEIKLSYEPFLSLLWLNF